MGAAAGVWVRVLDVRVRVRVRFWMCRDCRARCVCRVRFICTHTWSAGVQKKEENRENNVNENNKSDTKTPIFMIVFSVKILNAYSLDFSFNSFFIEYFPLFS